MKKLFLLFLNIITFISLVFAQDDIKQKLPPNINIPPGIDLNNVNPSDINIENLKKAGATDQQIQEALEYKKQQEQSNNSNISNEQNAGVNESPSSEEKSYEEKEKEMLESIEKEEEIKRKMGANEAGTVYGQDFFRNNNLQLYEKASSVKAPDNYILDTGDEINIAIWGFSDFNEVYNIDEFGSIQPKLIGKIYLKGLSFKEAKSLITYRFGQVYDLQNSKIEVVLIYSRIISVNIVGEVINPGTYKLPAINTAFNALIAVGGPNDMGSLRKIYIKRSGEVIKILDVYKFLFEPESDQDFFLENNDYIFIPKRGKSVTISGKVNRPHSYELLEKENLMTLLTYSGGFKASAYKEIIQIKRFNNNKEEILLDINLDSLTQYKKDFDLMDGDEVLVKRIPAGIINTVEINGAVKLPGLYEFKQGVTIKDIIEKAEGLRIDAFLNEAILTRTNEDLSQTYLKIDLSKVFSDTGTTFNLPLMNFDNLKILSKSDFISRGYVTIEGDGIRKPGMYHYGDQLSLKQLILNANGLRENVYLERGYIIRKNNDLTKEYISIALDTSNYLKSLENVYLQKWDIVKIFSEDYFNDEYFVSVNGYVRQNGKYPYDKNMTLSDALILSGGFKDEAAIDNIEISRISNFNDVAQENNPTKTEIIILDIKDDITSDNVAKNFKLSPYDQIFVRKIPDFDLQRNISITGEVKYPGTYTLQNKDEKLLSIISRAGGLSEWAFAEAATLYRKQNNIGYLMMQLNKTLKKPKSKTNYILEENDLIHIPKIIDFINLSGAIDYPFTDNIYTPYHKGKRAKFYIKKYGSGFHQKASKKSTYVIRINGLKRNAVNFGLFKIYPKVKKGSKIYISFKQEKVKKEKNKKLPIDWNRAIEGFTIKTMGILTMYIIVQQIDFNKAFNP